MLIANMYNVVTSTLATLARARTGIQVLPEIASCKRPEKLLTLYLKESCPWSRQVREGLSILDIDSRIQPCPKEGTVFRPELKKLGGKEQVPFLVDPNSDSKIYESSEILKHVFNKYGPGESKIPYLLKGGFIPITSSKIATILRGLPWHGLFQYKGDVKSSLKSLIPSKISDSTHFEHPIHPKIEKPIHLYNFEGCPYCRIVREALDSLEIPYIVHNVAKSSPKRSELVELGGKMQVPFLFDENNNKKLFESKDIVDYLYATYSPTLPSSK